MQGINLLREMWNIGGMRRLKGVLELGFRMIYYGFLIVFVSILSLLGDFSLLDIDVPYLEGNLLDVRRGREV